MKRMNFISLFCGFLSCGNFEAINDVHSDSFNDFVAKSFSEFTDGRKDCLDGYFEYSVDKTKIKNGIGYDVCMVAFGGLNEWLNLSDNFVTDSKIYLENELRNTGEENSVNTNDLKFRKFIFDILSGNEQKERCRLEVPSMFLFFSNAVDKYKLKLEGKYKFLPMYFSINMVMYFLLNGGREYSRSIYKDPGHKNKSILKIEIHEDKKPIYVSADFIKFCRDIFDKYGKFYNEKGNYEYMLSTLESNKNNVILSEASKVSVYIPIPNDRKDEAINLITQLYDAEIKQGVRDLWRGTKNIFLSRLRKN